MTTEQYIRHPWFEAHGCAVKQYPDKPAKWIPQPNLKYLRTSLDWENHAILCHHTNFDGLILSHHYGIRPKVWLDTLSMARLLLGNHISVSLDSVRKHFGMPSKRTPYNLFKGKHWAELPAATQHEVVLGACDEVESIWKIFNLLAKDFPKEEYPIVDMTTRMFTEPVLEGDINLLADIWEAEANAKGARYAALGITEADVQSADKFAELLRLEGIEPERKTGKNGNIYAFAKTDAFMETLLEDPSERVRTLAEARLGAKSTILQTRAETFGHMARRGRMPVYLRYAGAGTLRFSGGDGTNFQNLKRQHPIRKALMAPEGHLLFPVDSAQVECRVLNYLAGQDDVVDKFRRGEDPYVGLASLAYGEKIYKPAKDDPRREEMEAKRGMGKQGELMCFGPCTLVWTNHGIKPIIAVTIDDLLWDGVEWVKHRGLIFKGVQSAVDLKGVKVTSDHPILCGTFGWLPAAECLQDERILSQALENGSANLPLRDMNWDRGVEFNSLLCVAHAKHQNILFILTTYIRKKVQNVFAVLNKNAVFGLKNIMAMPMCALMKNIGIDCLLAFQQLSIVAEINEPRITLGTIMEAEEFRCIPHGKKEQKEDENFSRIWLRYQDGIIQICKSIVSIIKKATAPGILDLQRVSHKIKTSDGSEILKTKLPTFDIAFAGPRNRFTIVSSAGPLIVHNCGYGAAWKQFKKTAHNGLYGPPVDLSDAMAQNFVTTYRDTHPAICAPHHGYWAQAGRMLARLAGGDPTDWGPLRVQNHRIYLPNGCPLIYDTLEYYRPGPDEEVRHEFERGGYWRVRTRQGWKTIWGSKLVQNICEAVSRVIVTQAAIRIMKAGYRILNLPHDELLVLIPDDGNPDKHGEFLIGEMRREVPWLPGLPLDAEGHASDRYSK